MGGNRLDLGDLAQLTVPAFYVPNSAILFLFQVFFELFQFGAVDCCGALQPDND